MFFVGLVRRDFSGVVTLVLELTPLFGSLLSCAIVIGYAVRAADRADREDDWR